VRIRGRGHVVGHRRRGPGTVGIDSGTIGGSGFDDEYKLGFCRLLALSGFDLPTLGRVPRRRVVVDEPISHEDEPWWFARVVEVEAV
jgi:hypothetical protein